MAFWLFMLIMNLLIPFTMIGFGFYFQKHPPKEINELFGYRTSLSMKNEDTWKTAHVQFGRVWLIWGWFSAAFSFPCMLLLYGKSDTACGIYGGLLCLLQCTLWSTVCIKFSTGTAPVKQNNERHRILCRSSTGFPLSF